LTTATATVASDAQHFIPGNLIAWAAITLAGDRVTLSFPVRCLLNRRLWKGGRELRPTSG
jgi:hypothetical protein